MNKEKLLIVLIIIAVLLVVGIKIVANNNLENIDKTLDISEISGEETKVLLYFIKKDNKELASEYRYVNVSDIKNSMLETIMNELIKGPKSAELLNTIPEGTIVNDITQNGGKVVVDFSREFNQESDDESTKLQKIYSVVNTLTEIKEVEEVEILVEGESLGSKKRI